MNKTALLLLASVLALSTNGCSFFSDFVELRKNVESERIEPIDIATSPNSDQSEILAESEEVAEASNERQIAGLIPTTDPETRVSSVSRGRQDPFSSVSVQAQIEVEEEEVPPPPRVTSMPTFEDEDDEYIEDDEYLAEEDDFFDPPEEEFLEPTLAQEVLVTGVVRVDGRDKIIVTAPEEASSRYVEVGQYLSNGQILVKSINFNSFPTPVVVLEQFGVEVVKEVGGSIDSEDEFI